MRYTLRVHLNEETVLERTVEADYVVLKQGPDSAAETIDLGRGGVAALVALRYAVQKGDGLPMTELDCLVTVGALPDEEDPE